jgi:hypothetical protein
MIEVIRSNILAPLCTRAGVFIAGTLVPLGVSSEHATQVGIGVTAAGLVIFDLVLANIRKRMIQRSAVAKAVGRAN